MHPRQTAARLVTALGLGLGAVGATWAAPVSFSVSAAAFSPGAGYGVDASELGGTLLDVAFSALPGLHGFDLAAVSDSASFQFGNVTLRESGLINASETDDLGVEATLLFLMPFAGLRTVEATGTATVGIVNDPDIDLTLNWDPLLVAFGNGGLFGITLNELNFRFSGQTRRLDATITLLREPQAVSSPGSLWLVLGALLAAGLVAQGPRRCARG